MKTQSANIMNFPPWPADVPTAKLNKLSLAKLLQNDNEESASLFTACKASGFFLLDLRGCEDGDRLLEEAQKAFDFAEAICAMSIEEKVQYPLTTAFGYKAVGVTKVDSKGTPDRGEFWGLAKETIFGRAVEGGVMPPLAISNRPFLQKLASDAHSVGLLILTHLEKHLQLPKGTMRSVHRLEAPSADQVRFLKFDPQSTEDRGPTLLAHTDIGSLTFLWNVVGGLQILPPEAGDSDIDGTSEKWQYVRPEPGCVIVNIGDSIVSLTGGAVRSNLHRVTTPPGSQIGLVRYSVVYFMRPEDDVLMRSLRDGLAHRRSIEDKEGSDDKGYLTIKEWVALKAASFNKALVPMKSNGGDIHVDA